MMTSEINFFVHISMAENLKEKLEKPYSWSIICKSLIDSVSNAGVIDRVFFPQTGIFRGFSLYSINFVLNMRLRLLCIDTEVP